MKLSETPPTLDQTDLSFAVSSLARYSVKPSLSHWKEVKKTWQYLCHTKDLKFTIYPIKPEDFLSIYSDATWAELNHLVKSFHEGVWLKALINKMWNLPIKSAAHFIDDEELNQQLTVEDKTFKE
ncbi:hypothetical protein VP01_1309g2 [Puccinia sorghi]|uniref:Uncharacterized protein n=1 Tax=Puccinia sorghi TaxID=27349 RepID=A0A0L6VPQ2_9BASI|nr:hypothetical protein VP01_1309g2 [Puccinia sorghi]